METHSDSSTVTLAPQHQKSFHCLIHCTRKGCLWAGWAPWSPTNWQAYHILGEHLIQAHVKPGWTRGD